MGLLNLRNALMAGKRKPYKSELEYLENISGDYSVGGAVDSGNCGSYINTGIYPSASGVVEIGFSLPVSTPSNAYQTMFGGYDGNTKNFGVVFTGSTTYFLYGNQTSKAINFTGGERYDVVFDASEKSLSVNGTVSTFQVSGFSGLSNAPIYLFTNSAKGSLSFYNTTYTLKGRIHYFRYYDNDVLTCDFIPVLDWNDVPCMYDRVSGKCFYNQGTGDFVGGPDKN